MLTTALLPTAAWRLFSNFESTGRGRRTATCQESSPIPDTTVHGTANASFDLRGDVAHHRVISVALILKPTCFYLARPDLYRMRGK